MKKFILLFTFLIFTSANAKMSDKDKSKNTECNKFIYKQIKGSEEKIEKLSRTIYAG